MKAFVVPTLALLAACHAPEVATPGPPHALVVLVRSAGDVPVAGARVQLFPGPAEREYTDYDAFCFRPSADPPRAISEAVTDRKGAVAFVRPPPGRYWISATAAGFGRETAGVALYADEASPAVVVPLVRGAPLSGTITGDDGEPWTGVPVIAAPTSQCRVWPSDAACDRSRTDGTGRFRFDALVPGDYGIWYRPDGGALVSAGIVRVPLVADLPVRACRGGVLAGVVRDAETGAALGGALVRVVEHGGTVLVEARTDPAGRFEAATHLAVCDPAPWVVLPGYAPAPVRVTDGLMEGFRDGQRLDLDIALAKGATLRGQVLGAFGPAAGVRVSCDDSRYDSRGPKVTSEADGTYRFPDLNPGEHLLRVELAPGIEEEFTVDVAAGADVQHDLHLDDLRLSDVRGRVVDDKGNPVSGARVGSGDGPRRAETRTDAQGRFGLRVTTLHGVAEIAAAPPSGSDLIRLQQALHVSDGDVEISLMHIYGGGIHGHVRAADGSPIAGARIAAYAWTPYVATTSTVPLDFDNLREGVTAPDGSYVFHAPRDGDLARAWWADFVRAWSPIDGTALEPDGVDEGATWRYDVSFVRARTVSGRAVLKGSDRGIEGLSVSVEPDLYPTSVAVCCAVTGKDGRFRVPFPAADPPSIEVAGAGHVTNTVKPGDGGDLLVEMQPDLPVTGIVRRKDGSPSVLAGVKLQGADGWKSEPSATDTGGRFVITGVPPGDYVLLVDDIPVSAAKIPAGTRGLEIVVATAAEDPARPPDGGSAR